MIAEIIHNIFMCKCNSFHGVKNVRQVKDQRIVGGCLNCGKRVYCHRGKDEL